MSCLLHFHRQSLRGYFKLLRWSIRMSHIHLSRIAAGGSLFPDQETVCSNVVFWNGSYHLFPKHEPDLGSKFIPSGLVSFADFLHR